MNPGEREDEAWMALPLFNREDSPVEQSRNVLLLSTEATMADLAGDGLDGLDLYDVPVTASRADSGCESAGWMEASYDESNDIVWLEPASEGNQIDSQQPGGGGEQEQEQIGCTPSTCPFPGCKSTLQFARARDFRRHYKQHFKRFFCRHPGCPRSEPMTMTMTMTTAAGVDSGRGFATRKDRARHEARHNPGIRCPWHDGHGEQCPRMFSRTDNMRDHVRRIHMSS